MREKSDSLVGCGAATTAGLHLKYLCDDQFGKSPGVDSVAVTHQLFHILATNTTLRYASSGYNISSGRTFSSNSSAVNSPSATVASFSVVPSLCAFFAHFATSAQKNHVRAAIAASRITYYRSRDDCSESSQASEIHSTTN